MGRLLEYNRFDNDDTDNKKDVVAACKHEEFLQKSPCVRTKPKTQKYKKFNEDEDYEEYENYDNHHRVCPPYSELYPNADISQPQDKTTSDTTSSTAASRTKSTRKSVEIAIKNQLSKFLMQNHDEEKQQDDCEMVNSEAPPKRPKVYDCMRDFLRKKFFQPTVSVSGAVTEESESIVFDEVDYLTMMDSYDFEEDGEEEVDGDECLLVIASDKKVKTKYSRSVDVGCWPNSNGDDEVDSDAGIKDCCQLLSVTGSPKTEKVSKSPKRKVFEIPAELKDVPWFQPTISSKAATEKLIKEDPGAFLVRQSSSLKPGNFILCLKMEAKVKKFVIIGSTRCYKIKGAKKEFSSLKALVTHHSVMAEQLPVTLTLPRTTDEKSSRRYLDDFDTFESLQILGILKFLQSKNLEFS